ncbi:MAG: DUF1592 domain-containing protein [Gammaproteobacteria bacterium]|nr:DUF1592 domain-containing protein [Gammaproteobacteria bacterium]
MKSWTGIALLALTGVCGAQHAADPARYDQTLNQYCITCHNDALQTAGLSLQRMKAADVGASAATWEKVLRKLRARAMPPNGVPRPADTTYASLATYLEAQLDQHARRYPQPGRPSMRRLNRTEYVNSIRELFAIEVDGDMLLPPDDAMFGFDNIGTVLTLSPLLVERYIAAARKIRLQALGNPDIIAKFDYYAVPEGLLQDDRMGDDLPFGSRGGIAVRHDFPADGEYVIQLRLQRNYRDYIRGLVNKEHRLDVRMNDERIELFTFGGEKHGRSSGLYSTSAQGDVAQEQYERYADQDLEVRFFAEAGPQLITATFLQENFLYEGPLRPEHTVYDYTQYKGGKPALKSLAIGGPFAVRGHGETVSRARILLCTPATDADEACARRIVTRLARHAYRRPPMPQEIDVLLGFYRQGQQRGGFEEGVGAAIERILAGPEFLFIAERVPENVPPGELYAVSDLELASRLAFFIWSQIPDEELLDLAESGQLQDADVLEQQVRRMLDDPRSRALVENFAAQWLTLGKLNIAAPDIEIFPYFDENLRQAFRKETELFIDHVLRQERPLLELLTADYTFVNERLAKHYQIPDVYGNHFRKVKLPDDERGGLLGQGSILTVTSYANRTAPTIRGKWILENILGAPPPPPPANVPGLREKNDAGVILTMRERMEQHRANPVCASCHKVMDPLGFALENYDAIGRWRTVDAASATPIDASGALPDGTAFDGPLELRAVLLAKRKDDFIYTAVEKLMTYALGREIVHSDAPFIRAIIEQAQPDEYSLPSLITAVVKSTPYQMRRVSSRDDI